MKENYYHSKCCDVCGYKILWLNFYNYVHFDGRTKNKHFSNICLLKNKLSDTKNLDIFHLYNLPHIQSIPLTERI